jgi:hypothetical protein
MAKRSDRNKPAGPAPMMPTRVRIFILISSQVIALSQQMLRCLYLISYLFTFSTIFTLQKQKL